MRSYSASAASETARCHSLLVERIDGDYFTVMGLGLGLFVDLLGRVGLDYRFGSVEALTPRP